MLQVADISAAAISTCLHLDKCITNYVLLCAVIVNVSPTIVPQYLSVCLSVFRIINWDFYIFEFGNALWFKRYR